MVVQWKVIAYVLADMTESNDSVPAREIYSHPIMQGWYAQSDSSPTSHIPQIDRRLQERTSRESTTVGSEPRREPFLFDKTPDANWYLTPNGWNYVFDEIIPSLGPEIEQKYGSSEKLSQDPKLLGSLVSNESDDSALNYHLVSRIIKQRRGQPDFRRKLLSAYGGVCSVTGSNATEALEAAHITPVAHNGTMAISNGILMRADVHTLFDLGLLTVNPENMRVELSESLRDTDYAYLHDKKINLPILESNLPSVGELSIHYTKSKAKNVYR